MGACILKNQPNIDQLCSRPLEFQVDRSRHNKKALLVWKICTTGCQVLKWPYKFHSTSSYVVLVMGASSYQHAILHRDRTSIELAQMLFGAQFLLPHLTDHKKIILNDKYYSIALYSFFGDSIVDQLMQRARLSYYVNQILKYMELGAGFLCLSTLNEAQPLSIKDDIKQFVDFDSEQYEEAKTHIFFQQQLFTLNKSLRNSLEASQNSILSKNFRVGSAKIPYIQIKQVEQQIFKKEKQKKKNELEQQMPFACEITQINIKNDKKANKIEPVNIEDSNIFFDQFAVENEVVEIQKIQEFLKGLYLTTEKVSKNFNVLNNKQVRLIVNCSASSCKNWFINDVNYKWLDMPDPCQSNQEYNLQCLIYQVADLAGKCLSQSSGVVIHCSGYHPKVQYSGSRSAAILIGLIMSALKISFEDSLEMVNKKWKIKLPAFMEKQLRNLHKRMLERPKGFHVYSICSYSKNFPTHLVAKYICEVENTNNIQGIDDFAKSVYLCVGPSAAKIMTGRQCQLREEYQKYAKEHLRLLSKYEGFNGQCNIELIDKTFRKQPKIETKQQILHISSNESKNAGFLRNEQVVLKYPILRPIWEKKKQDAFYFTIREKQKGAQVIMNKGMNWIGYEEDKQQFFDKIVGSYLSHIPHELIFISESESDQSLFDESGFKI